MILNPENRIPEELKICIDDVNIEPQKSVNHLIVTLENKLNFKSHIISICRSASCQLNALFDLKHFLGFNEGKTLS